MKNLEPTENEIQTSICDYLTVKKHFFWRQNVLPAMTKDGRVRRMPKYSKNGVPDIILVHLGFFIGLEVKRKKSIQSDSQKQFEKDLKEVGGYYYIVRSIEDVQEIGL